ncbi:hypothetical protein D3C81_1190240 [compost metagenome]
MAFYSHGKTLFLQALSFAGAARLRTHEPFNEFTNSVRGRLPVPAFQIRDNTFKSNIGLLTLTKVILIAELYPLRSRTIEQLVHLILGKLRYWNILRDMIMLRNGFQILRIVVGRAACPGLKCPVLNTLTGIRNEQLRINYHLGSQTITLRASSEWTVE